MFKRVTKEEWTFPADLAYLGQMRDSVMHFGRKHGVSDHVINAFKLAIDEAGTNIIRHAYRDWEGQITMRMIIRDKDVTVSLIDQGHTFDPRQVKDPDLQRYVKIGKKGGLGIFIIRRLVDRIDYRKTPEGNELRLTKLREREPRRLRRFEFSMKTRFSLIASGILTFLIFVGFAWTYFRIDDRIRGEAFSTAERLAKAIGFQSIEYLASDPANWWDLSTLVSDIHREYQPRLVEILVLDTLDVVQGVVRFDRLHSVYRLPTQAKAVRGNVYCYPFEKTWVYDHIEPAMRQVAGRNIRLGTVHLLTDKQLIDATIASQRRRTLITGLLALLLGYGFTFGLVYVTMSPFKRLAQWVRDLGHGEVRDEMEFDGNDEIGEIAQAFSEITEKFRKSQENLAEQERLRKEMQVAQEIQHTLLPEAFPEIEGFEIASYYEAAKEVGGDYYDFFRVDRDSLGIVVADVSGKGVPGSLVMTMIRTALRTEARGNKNAADVLARVNDFVINDMKRGMFVTVFYLILDSKRRTINYASAGHNPMILYRGETQKSYYLNPHGFPIGINLPDRSLFRKSIESDTLQLRPEDVLIIYTDGITEAMDANRNQFGDERFLEAIRKYGNLKVQPLVDGIRQEILTFTGGEPQNDDITLVAIREKLSAEEVLLTVHEDLFRLIHQEGLSVKEACEKVGVSTSTYYKYRKLYEEEGWEGLKEHFARTGVEERHIAIEDKAKIFDVIKAHPEYGPKRICEELNTEKYGFFQIDEDRLYGELVRCRLNTKELRMAFVERGGRGQRMKTPGTPLLTLDGRVIIPEVKTTPPPKPLPPPSPSGQEIPAPSPVEKRAAPPVSPLSAIPEKEEEEWIAELEGDLETLDAVKAQAASSESDEAVFELPVPPMEAEETEEVSSEAWIEEVSHQEEAFSFEDLLEEPGSLVEDIENRQTPDQVEVVNDRSSSEFASEWIVPESLSPVVEGLSENLSDALLDEEIASQTSLSQEGPPAPSVVEATAANARLLNRVRFLEAGQWFYQEGLYARAIEEFGKAIACDPRFGAAYQAQGDAYFRLGQYEKALRAYQMAKSLMPDNLLVQENLGVVYANLGDFKKAVWQWGEVLKWDPNRPDLVERIRRVQRLIRRGVTFEKKS